MTSAFYLCPRQITVESDLREYIWLFCYKPELNWGSHATQKRKKLLKRILSVVFNETSSIKNLLPKYTLYVGIYLYWIIDWLNIFYLACSVEFE